MTHRTRKKRSEINGSIGSIATLLFRLDMTKKFSRLSAYRNSIDLQRPVAMIYQIRSTKLIPHATTEAAVIEEARRCMRHSRFSQFESSFSCFLSRVAASCFPRVRKERRTGKEVVGGHEGMESKIKGNGSRLYTAKRIREDRESRTMHSCVFLRLRLDRDEKHGQRFLTLLPGIKKWKRKARER